MSRIVDAIRALLKDPATGQYLSPYVDVAEAAKTDKDGNEITATYSTKTELEAKENAGVCLPLAGGTMTGKITGTITKSESADTANKDSAGQQINSTYIKSVRTSGTQVIFTRGDGTEFSVWTQDTNTNTSNWSVSNGTNGWARDNSTGFTVQWGELGYPNNKSTDVYFPRSFSSTTYQVDLSFRKGSYANNSGCLLTWERVANNIVRISGGQQSSFTGCSWIAVGFS
ncbi:gp53-like domain-containing protein [Turicimonas muris]